MTLATLVSLPMPREVFAERESGHLVPTRHSLQNCSLRISSERALGVVGMMTSVDQSFT
jgi:hypothetical protein